MKILHQQEEEAFHSSKSVTSEISPEGLVPCSYRQAGSYQRNNFLPI